MNVKIKLGKNSFCLMAGEEFKVKILSAIMFVRKVKLSPSVVTVLGRRTVLIILLPGLQFWGPAIGVSGKFKCVVYI